MSYCCLTRKPSCDPNQVCFGVNMRLCDGMFAVQVRGTIYDEVKERIRPEGVSFAENLKAIPGVGSTLTLYRYDFSVDVVDHGMQTIQMIIDAFKEAYGIDSLTVV